MWLEEESHDKHLRPQLSIKPPGRTHSSSPWPSRSPLGIRFTALKSPRRVRRLAIYAFISVLVFGVYVAWNAQATVPGSRIPSSEVFGNSHQHEIHTDVALEAEISTLENIHEMGHETQYVLAYVPEITPEPQYSPWVLGAPTQSFRDNLRPDTLYITSWLDAGWNNDVMTIINLIYLGLLTDRIPVLPMFTSSPHVGRDVPLMNFGEVFDLPRFERETGMSVVEWHEVKDTRSGVIDELGCWNIWESVQYEEHKPRQSDGTKRLGLDIAYTRTPDWIEMMPGIEYDKGSSFLALASLDYPEDRNNNLWGDITPSPLHGATLQPDEHLLCYDYLYYIGGHQTTEWELEDAPDWRYVGRHLHWTSEIERIAASYVRRTFGLSEGDEIPPYITIHVRHGDFSGWCQEAKDFKDCFAPLSAIAKRVQEVQDELFDSKEILIPDSRVIMTSDETDESWWNEVAAYGWQRINHVELQTTEKYSRWYPLILDAAIQSNSLGFVGTDRSAFSILSKRRVLDRHGGAVRMVRWGKKGADNHR